MWPASRSRDRRLDPVGALGCLAFVLIGWSGLLVPSLIRSVKDAFGQSDAGIGLFYFVFSACYASGSLAGGWVTERLGRRSVLAAAAGLHAAGLLLLAAAPAWGLFLAAAAPTGLGAGAVDGGVNGLFLDRFREGRGRALNLLHVFFSLGALTAPLVIGQLVASGVGWQAVVLATGAGALPVAALFALVRMPDGRRGPSLAPDGTRGGVARLSVPLLVLAVAIACYVASEVGVSNWLVRFLEPAPIETATLGLSLFWAGLTAGRLVSARLADRFDHTVFALGAVILMSAALLAATVAPSVEWSIALFALTGFASGPIFPMIVAIGGDLHPERSAAVGGLLSGAAVAGSVVYPPVMGYLSVTVGLTVAMAGNAVLGVACAVMLLAAARGQRAVAAHV